MVNFIAWLIAGAVIGSITTLLIRRRRSILPLNIVVGSAGAIIAGYWLLPRLHISTTSLNWPFLLVSLGSTIIPLAVVNFFVREHTVENLEMKAQWYQVHYKIRARWSKFTREDIEQIDGSHDRLIGLIQERYGIDKEEAEDQVQRFLWAAITKGVTP